ncbi:MAG: histidine phosphatase family protein [Gammaproteobacteria bacterium]|nr:histidine phosphatase family protein [Gammaproteobacteria bacterium]
MKRFNLINLLLLLVMGATGQALAAQADLVEQMKSGNTVLMIRHALAPGVGDPDNFRLRDCTTQRNLNDTGREQAKAIGQWLRDRGIDNVRLYSSQWCRCLETARLMQMGEVTELTALNSFFQDRQNRDPYLSALRQFMRDNSKPDQLIIMVTHQVTISGITGEWTDSGHAKLVQPTATGEIQLLGDISFD